MNSRVKSLLIFLGVVAFVTLAGWNTYEHKVNAISRRLRNQWRLWHGPPMQCEILGGPILLQQSSESWAVVWDATPECHKDSLFDLLVTEKRWVAMPDESWSWVTRSVLVHVNPTWQSEGHVVYRAAFNVSQEAAQITVQVDHSLFPVYGVSATIRCLPGLFNSTCNPIRIGVLGDNQYGAVVFDQLATSLATIISPTHLLHVGDAVQDQDLSQWQTDFFDVVRDSGLGASSVVIYESGNHDMSDTAAHLLDIPVVRWEDEDRILSPTFDENTETHKAELLRVTSVPWRSIRIANICIVMIDSNTDSPVQDAFIKNTLKEAYENAEVKFTIVVSHIPPFMEWWEPNAWFNKGESEWGAFVRVRYVPLFEKYSVDLVISGHQHNYQRGELNGVTYLIVGGAGGDLETDRVNTWPKNMFTVTHNVHHFGVMDVYEDSIYWHAYDLNSRLFDELVIKAQ